ncbi:MAG: DNA polymerase III subunit gamma/tau [Deltaproteobacteria bacterium]|nr:DNA polymerase III subunit gamma/tau [Deltaproteobacteria bacterium]
MTYTVLARKYRPQTFADLSGQEHVTRTLGNAIASGRVAHAFLFTGVRGVGKTTTARILAKALNCTTGPTMSPCGVCDACKEITAGNDLDVLEIDGASNNSVEDVRRLQETIPFRPARDRFKIVIVDEVHMLSVGAFNAFLKTLEEPPPHVKFIFATTESHKVPITIRSRCQRYDFRLIPQAVVSDRVKQILAAEGITADERAIAIVAREAAGSMRDALTLLDQVVAFSGGALVGDEVARVLGIADREILHGTASAILDGDGAAVLTQIDVLAQRGLDLLHFAKALVELLRDLVVLRVSGASTELVAMVEEERDRALTLSKRVEPLEIQRAFHAASLLVEDVARSPLPRMTLEMGLVRLAARPALRPVSDLVARLESLEASLGRGGNAPARSAAPRVAAREPASRAATPRRAAPSDEPEPDPEWSPEWTRADDDLVRSVRDEDTSFLSSVGTIAAPSLDEPTVERPSAAPAPAQRPVATPDRASSAPRASSPPPQHGPPIDPGALSVWETMVGVLTDTKPALGALLKHAVPRRIDAELVELSFPPGSFYGKQAESAEARNAIAHVAERRLGAKPRIEIVYGAPTGGTLAQIEDERERARLEATRKKALNHPVVQEALRVFETSPGAVEVRVDVEETG